MEAKDEKTEVLQAIFSSVFGFNLPLNVPTNIQKLHILKETRKVQNL